MEEVREEMDAAVQFALDDPLPEPEAALNHVYA
jgi:TPP-dependent pyruvate/acetoin dehydrogenase alpha subunit